MALGRYRLHSEKGIIKKRINMRISPSEAIERITSQSEQRRSKASAPMELVRSVEISDEGSIYLIRQGDFGYISPADDAFSPVIGESEETDFTIELPPCYEEMLNDYAKEVEWWQTIGQRITEEAASPTMQRVAAIVASDVEPLIKTKWNQTAPWNQNLKFEGKSCYVGCVPLSIGQLLFYWWQLGFSRGCTASDAYKTKTNLYEVAAMEPVTVFDFDKMVTGKPTTAEAKKAVADMLEHIGKAIKADYKPTSTGVYLADYEKALKSVFRLGDNITHIYASKLGLATFCERIRKELESGRPVMMSGYNSSYSGGHSFLCDGYRAEDDKFHYNWGWGGTYNGWFKMGALKPTSSINYSYYKHAFLGIQPSYKLGDVNRDGAVDISDVLGAVDAAVKGEYKEEADVNSDGKVDISDAATIVDGILGKTKL